MTYPVLKVAKLVKYVVTWFSQETAIHSLMCERSPGYLNQLAIAMQWCLNYFEFVLE